MEKLDHYIQSKESGIGLSYIQKTMLKKKGERPWYNTHKTVKKNLSRALPNTDFSVLFIESMLLSKKSEAKTNK